ncbi:MAG TPA: hypothetical protein VFG07_04415 [Thermoplasmata archaeon]|nr:hypothetical protein [Thermoplasmata archaeon]
MAGVIPRTGIDSNVLRRFDVRSEDDQLFAAGHLSQVLNRLYLAAFFGVGGFLIVFGWLELEWALVGLGVFTAAFGAIMSVRILGSERTRLRSVEVGRELLSLSISNSEKVLLAWRDSALKIRLYDYRGSHDPNVETREQVPCAIEAGRIFGGLSLEAFKAIREQAQQAGAPVVDIVPDSGGRAVYIGNWPNVQRPFSEPGPPE